MWQTIAVGIIGVALVIYLAIKIVRAVQGRGEPICGGCPLSEECAKSKQKRKTCDKTTIPPKPSHKKKSCCH